MIKKSQPHNAVQKQLKIKGESPSYSDKSTMDDITAQHGEKLSAITVHLMTYGCTGHKMIIMIHIPLRSDENEWESRCLLDFRNVYINNNRNNT